MQNLAALKKNKIKIKALTTLCLTVAAAILPQIFHAAGMAAGLDSTLGAAFLPMQLPVLLAGLVAGPAVGMITGIISPLLSFVISGMPTAAALPFMVVELACYGLVCGILRKTKMSVILKLLSAQIIGRAVRAAAIVVAVYGFSIKGITITQAYNVVLIGLPGILLQWALVPLLVYRFKGLRKYYD